MNKRTKRLVAWMALCLGTAGAAGAVIMRKSKRKAKDHENNGDVWARPGMQVIFRAELMPGRDGSERVFRVKELLPSGRVLLHDFAGEHAEGEFEPVR